MKDLEQKVAYLQGLADGMELEESKEGKLISEMLEVLEDIAEYLSYMREDLTDIEDYMESIDSDLTDLEEDFYGDEEGDEDDGYVEVECPNCHEMVCFDEAILYDEDLIEVTCPVCEAVVFVNGDEDDEEDGEADGCGCGCEDEK
ncbi:MAG: AraC family transcriptional regulator [Bacillota bacterium]|nr:AraC family transcriptional regulator [Bacillota bacterium]